MNNSLAKLIRHIETVKDSCLVLGEKLIEHKEADVGKALIANGHIHDNSKFYGIEWLYLNEETKGTSPENFQLALTQHITTNKHHPEAWIEGVKSMPREYLAEMICDWHARAHEFGTDLRSWFKDKAASKYKICRSSKEYKSIKELIDMLLEKSFQ